MKSQTKRNWLFTGVGFLIGTAGIAALTSDTAKKGYVHAMAQGIKAKNDYQDLVEKAKAEYDDMVAEANYIAVGDATEPQTEAKSE